MRTHPAPPYHAFTVAHLGLVDRIHTMISISAAFDPKSPPDPPPQEIERVALWDTGATRSVVTESTVQSLGLVPAGLVSVHHAGGIDQRHTYLVNIRLPNNVGVIGVLVSECPDVSEFGVIIGMDIISQGDFSITNVQSRTVLSFRIPSIMKIDYVVEANRERFVGVGRNDPCPCGKMNPDGSRVKFKNCHLGML